MKSLLKVTAIVLTVVAGATAAQAEGTHYLDGYADWAKDALSTKK